MNEVSVRESCALVENIVKRHSDIKMPGSLKDWRDKGVPWAFRLVDLRIEGPLAHVIINRPEAMNALNEEVFQQLHERFQEAEKVPSVKAIVLEGTGKAFVAGADIRFFIDKIEQDRIEDIAAFTRRGHEILKNIDGSKKLVIARLDGLALGGGVELALTADVLVASERTTLGFPETGIGIYPGLGGTQRTPRYIGKELAKYLILTGRTIDARRAKDMGLVQYLVQSDKIDGFIRGFVSKARIRRAGRPPKRLTAELEAIKRLFTDDNVVALLSGKAPGEGETAQGIAKQISRKAPVALKLANRLIDEGLKGSLEAGLELELRHLKEIFSTKDALVGLRAVGRGRPEFKGE
jgi:enoyl-CoA hydratase/3-hydroxyacyl-CoA dehydrogenase